MKKQKRPTIDMAAIAASPYFPATTLSASVDNEASPCRESDGVPPNTISFRKMLRKANNGRQMPTPPPLNDIRSRMRKPTTWLMRVAIAAPCIPISKLKISRGSSNMFNTAPENTPNMAYMALPWKRIWLLSVKEVVIKGAPSKTMPR